jgi:hypothetical protein
MDRQAAEVRTSRPCRRISSPVDVAELARCYDVLPPPMSSVGQEVFRDFVDFREARKYKKLEAMDTAIRGSPDERLVRASERDVDGCVRR